MKNGHPCSIMEALGSEFLTSTSLEICRGLWTSRLPWSIVEDSWTACISTGVAYWMNDLSHLRQIHRIAIQQEVSKILSFVLVNKLRSELQKLAVTGN